MTAIAASALLMVIAAVTSAAEHAAAKAQALLPQPEPDWETAHRATLPAAVRAHYEGTDL